MIRGTAAAAAMAASLTFAASAASQASDGPAGAQVRAREGEMAAYRIPTGVGSALRVDGLLSDEIWAGAPVTTGFRQREPSPGEPATERTEVRVAYDDVALYVGIMAYDAEPDRIVARILQRDKLMEPDPFRGGLSFAGDDGVAILIDPFHDHRNGIVFATNPNGAEFEALLANQGAEINVDWRGVWQVAAARTDEGWSAEFAIPWRTLRYPDASPETPWGFNIFRIIRRKNEQALWQAWSREQGFHRVAEAGHLTGLLDLPRQELNLEVKPFVLGGTSRELDDDTGLVTSDGRYETGLDLKSELRPGLVLDVTVNTDFAQVEVDDEKVNLTRFDLFFPEKRDFFLENSGIFQFGVPSNPLEPPPFQMFFSRRIGIDEDEGVIPILGGARLTGRVGGQTVGAMSLRTGSAYGLPGETFSVLRVKRDVGEGSYLGAMLTDRRGGGDRNTVGGVDAQLVSGAWVWDAFVVRTDTRGPGGDDVVYRMAVNLNGDRWGLFVNHLGVGADAEAASGFITREDIRRSELYGGRNFRPRRWGLRRLSAYGGASYQTTMNGRLQDYSWGTFLNPEWEAGDQLNIFINRSETVLDEVFELTDSLDIPTGRYANDHIGFFGGTSKSRAAALDVNGLISRFYGGSLVSLGGTLTLAPTPQVALGIGYTRNVVDVPFPNGTFTASISSVRASYSFSTRLTTNVLVQYNSLDGEISTNARVNFIHRPGSDLFVVFTENRGVDDRPWDLRDRGLVVKITYLARI